MFSKSLFAFFILAVMSLAVFAQNAPVRGRVELTQADGKKIPVVGALVECFRTDIKGKVPGPKTDKKGEFVFAGLPFGGEFTLSVSGSGIAPATFSGVKAGREDIVISVVPGDGKRLTEDEVRSNSTAATSTEGLSAEQKKKYEEEQKKIAAVKENNAKIEEANKIILRVFAEGNAARDAKDYSLAIAKYSEGIAADGNHPGTPALLNAKSDCLRIRGVDRFNAAKKAGGAGIQEAKQDFIDSADAAKASIELLKTQEVPNEADRLKNYNLYKYNAVVAYAEGMRLVATIAEPTPERLAEMIAAYQAYFAAETDPLRKSKTQLLYARGLMEAQDFEKAVIEFEKLLAENPNDLPALYGAGLCLVNLGYLSSDKTQFQNGANYLAKYVEIAPDSDPAISKNKAELKEMLDTLKKEQNVTAQKPVKTTTVKKKP